MNFDDTRLFALPTRIHFGYGSIKQAGIEAKKLGITKALVVSDKNLVYAKVATPLLDILNDCGVAYEVFDDVPEDPGTMVVNKGVEMLKQSNCDGVVVIGGGSPMCAGKGIALIAKNSGNVRDYEGFEKYRKSPLPVIAIPTTAGSGSEVSNTFIISDELRNKYKMAIIGYDCFPEVAILDPLLMRNIPARQLIISGIDALSHAIEAICTNQATLLTNAIAYEAIRLIIKNLPLAAYSSDLDSKRDQLMASTMANVACGNAKLSLGHCVAQPVASYKLPHGITLGILLPYVMEFNLPACENEFARMADVIGVSKEGMTAEEKAKASIDAVKELLKKVDFPDRLNPDIVPESDIGKMAKIAMGRPNITYNLRKVTEDDIVKIYEKAYKGW